jgi:hypothetical protein
MRLGHLQIEVQVFCKYTLLVCPKSLGPWRTRKGSADLICIAQDSSALTVTVTGRAPVIGR